MSVGVPVSGERLVVDLDVYAGRDTLRGGAGDDTLVGDSDTTATIAGGGASAAAGGYTMAKLIDDLSVGAVSNDSLNGDSGTNLLESGNRASLGSGLVGKTSISSLSKTNAPAAVPVIDWNGKVSGGAGTNNASWIEDFVNGVGNNAGANSKIRIKL
jgi:hypothetical protein